MGGSCGEDVAFGNLQLEPNPVASELFIGRQGHNKSKCSEVRKLLGVSLRVHVLAKNPEGDKE